MNDFEYFGMTTRFCAGIETILQEMKETFDKCDNGEKIGKAIVDKFKKLNIQSREQRELFPELTIIPIECVILVDLRDAIKFISKKKYVTEHDKVLLLNICKLIDRVYKNI